MLSAIRPDLAGFVACYAAGRDWLTVAQVLAAYDRPALRGDVVAALRRCGFVRGFAFTRAPRLDLLVYENWLHLLVRKWCEGRPALTIAQFVADHPDCPSCPATRREIADCLGRLGYTHAQVRA